MKYIDIFISPSCISISRMIYSLTMNRGKPEKYIALAGSIQQLMQDMSLKSGDSLPSERKLAAHFKCNHITVRKALRLLAQKNIIHTIASKGNFAGAAPIQRSRSNLIGFIFPEDEIFYYKIFSAVEKMIASNKLHPVVHLTGGSEIKETELLDYCDKAGFLALIAVPNRLCAEHYKRMNIPVLFFDIPMEELDIPQIVTDDYSGAFSATEHLIGYGHRRIAHIGSEYDFTGEQRLNGFLGALAKHGIRCDKNLIKMRYPSREWGYYAARELFKCTKTPTAVFCSNDTIASGVMNYCAQNGIRVPQDLSVVGFGNTLTSEDLNLSSVSQNSEKIVNSLCSNLNLVLRGEQPPRKIIIPTSFISRGTVAVPPK